MIGSILVNINFSNVRVRVVHLYVKSHPRRGRGIRQRSARAHHHVSYDTHSRRTRPQCVFVGGGGSSSSDRLLRTATLYARARAVGVHERREATTPGFFHRFTIRLCLYLSLSLYSSLLVLRVHATHTRRRTYRTCAYSGDRRVQSSPFLSDIAFVRYGHAENARGQRKNASCHVCNTRVRIDSDTDRYR